MKNKKNVFEKREAVSPSYWKDPRWKEVQKLRDENEHPKANGLVMKIRADWNLE